MLVPLAIKVRFIKRDLMFSSVSVLQLDPVQFARRVLTRISSVQHRNADTAVSVQYQNAEAPVSVQYQNAEDAVSLHYQNAEASEC